MIWRWRVKSSSPNSSATRATRVRSSAEICKSGDSLPATLATTALRRKRTTWRAKWVGLWPSLRRLSTRRSTSSLEPRETACMTSSSTPEGAAPTNWRTDSAVRRPSQEAIAWSRIESASRMEPSPASASNASASSSAAMFSLPASCLSCRRICSNRTARKLKCWQRERMVCGMSSGCVVASMNTT